MKKMILLLAIFISFTGFINAQQPQWALYNMYNSGLPDYTVTSIAIDANGNKWIGTSAELVEFDNTNWNHCYSYELGYPNFIMSIAIDNSGNKWVGSYFYGLSKFDGINWTVYDTSNSGIPDSHGISIAIDGSDNKWVGTWGGLAKFDGTNWTVYDTYNSGLPSTIIKSIVIDSNQNKWIGTGYGLAKFDGLNWINYNSTNSGLPYDDVTSIAIDFNGDKWIGTDGGGIAKFNGTNWTVYNTFNSGLSNDNIKAIAIDVNGNKWIGSDFGMTKFDGVNWTVYNSSNSFLPDDYILTITIDGAGSKWIGTTNAGLAVFNENGISGYCSAYFYLYPDPNIQHQYYINNYATGVMPLQYLWNWGDGTTDTIAYPSHTYNNAGVYDICLSITDSAGCTSTFCDSSYYVQKDINTIITIDVIPPVITGISDITNKYSFPVYPNPATDKITIETARKATIEILNLQGQTLKTLTTVSTTTTIDISPLLKGMYFIKVKTEKGIAVKKFIKE